MFLKNVYLQLKMIFSPYLLTCENMNQPQGWNNRTWKNHLLIAKKSNVSGIPYKLAFKNHFWGNKSETHCQAKASKANLSRESFIITCQVQKELLLDKCLCSPARFFSLFVPRFSFSCHHAAIPRVMKHLWRFKGKTRAAANHWKCNRNFWPL